MSNALGSSADIKTGRSGGSSDVSPAVTLCDETASSLQPNRSWLYHALLFLFITLAFARGAYGLGDQSLWWDESLSLQRASYNLPHILSNEIVLTDTSRQVVTFDNHPPLYFLLLHFVVKLVGQSEFALRFPSLAFSVLTVPLLYAVGKYLFDRGAGLLAALFGAISPLYLWYSQEARMYTMLTFLGLLSFYSLLRILTSNVKRQTSNLRYPTSNLQLTIIYVLSSAAMSVTHYLSFLILLSEFIVFLSFLRPSTRSEYYRARWRRVAIPVLGVLLITLPVLYYGLSVLPKGETAGLRFVSLLELLRDASNSFSLGISVEAQKVSVVHWVFRGVFLIGTLAIVWRVFRRSTPNKALSALIYLLVPLLSIYFLSYVRPVYMNIRHLILASPAFYLILAVGLMTIRKEWPLVFVSCLAMMIAGSAHSTQQYFFDEKYAKDDHRSWGEYLKAHAQPGDVIVVDPPHTSQLYEYYADAGLPWTGLPRLASPEEDTVSALEELMAGYERIWLALSRTPPWGDPELLPKKWLEENAFLVDERSFHSYTSPVQAFCFLTNPPALNTLPEIQHALEANFEDKLQFLGYDLKGGPAVAGQFVHLNLYWRTQQELGEDYEVSLRLLDGENHLWGQASRAPLNGHYPTSQWSPGQMVKDDYELSVDVGTPLGWYRLEMAVHDGSHELDIVGEDSISRWTTVDIGILQVQKPASPPAVSGAAAVMSSDETASLPLEHRRGMAFGNLQLLGYDLAGESYRQGDWVLVQSYWQVKQKLVEDYTFYLRLVDENKLLWFEEVIHPAGDAYPTSFWDEGEIVKGQHALRISPDAPEGDYYVGVVLCEPEIAQPSDFLTDLFGASSPAGYALDMAKIHVIEVEQEFSVPPIQYSYQVSFGGLVEFLGYDLERTGFSSGDNLTLTLYWRVLEQMDTSYAVFTHLIDQDNRIWGQRDSLPQQGGHPTTLWVRGEVVTDSYDIPVDPDAPPGRYGIEIGLYDPVTGARLPVLDERGRTVDDRILLREVWVR
jgi:mannosyltransferase